jgi:hypothetical protein
MNINDPLGLSEMLVGVDPEILEAAKRGERVPEHDCHTSPGDICNVCEQYERAVEWLEAHNEKLI